MSGCHLHSHSYPLILFSLIKLRIIYWLPPVVIHYDVHIYMTLILSSFNPASHMVLESAFCSLLTPTMIPRPCRITSKFSISILKTHNSFVTTKLVSYLLLYVFLLPCLTSLCSMASHDIHSSAPSELTPLARQVT